MFIEVKHNGVAALSQFIGEVKVKCVITADLGGNQKLVPVGIPLRAVCAHRGAVILPTVNRPFDLSENGLSTGRNQANALLEYDADGVRIITGGIHTIFVQNPFMY